MVIHGQLVELIDRVPVLDSRVRRHEPGGVHKMRVTLRRLRSLLATFGPLFEDGAVTTLREELKWVAGELGGARDSQVVRQRLTAMGTTPEERAVTERLDTELEADELAGMQRSVTALDSERYSRLLRDLNSFATDPPWRPGLQDAGNDELRCRVLRDWKRLRRRVKRARAAAGTGAHQEGLHEVRKAAKRLRYSADTLVAVYGQDAKRLAQGAKRIQTELGEVQDSAVSQAVLSTRASAEGTQAEVAFVLGALHAMERQRTTDAHARFARTWGQVARKRNRRWLL